MLGLHVLGQVVVQGLILQHSSLVAPWHVGSYFPDQGSNPYPLHRKADS